MYQKRLRLRSAPPAAVALGLHLLTRVKKKNRKCVTKLKNAQYFPSPALLKQNTRDYIVAVTSLKNTALLFLLQQFANSYHHIPFLFVQHDLIVSRCCTFHFCFERQESLILHSIKKEPQTDSCL